MGNIYLYKKRRALFLIFSLSEISILGLNQGLSVLRVNRKTELPTNLSTTFPCDISMNKKVLDTQSNSACQRSNLQINYEANGRGLMCEMDKEVTRGNDKQLGGNRNTCGSIIDSGFDLINTNSADPATNPLATPVDFQLLLYDLDAGLESKEVTGAAVVDWQASGSFNLNFGFFFI